MAFLDSLKDWQDVDVAALMLGQALGIFPATMKVADVKAVLWTNNTAGNTVYGMLQRLVRLGVLESDDNERRYRAAPANLHPLSEVDDVPALETGPPARSHIAMSLGTPDGFTLEADRAGFRYLARVFDEVADSGVDNGWSFQRDQQFRSAAGGGAPFAFRLVDSAADDPAEKP